MNAQWCYVFWQTQDSDKSEAAASFTSPSVATSAPPEPAAPITVEEEDEVLAVSENKKVWPDLSVISSFMLTWHVNQGCMSIIDMSLFF